MMRRHHQDRHHPLTPTAELRPPERTPASLHFHPPSEPAEQATGGLGDRRGVSITIVPPRSLEEVALGSTTSPDSTFFISDHEFEKEFGLDPTSASASPSTLPDFSLEAKHMLPIASNPGSIELATHTKGASVEDSRQISGSSELPLQDLVERQRGSILAVFLRTIIFILIWYFFSTGLTIYNKKLLGQHMWDFPAPMLMNTVHFGLQAIISSCTLHFFFPSLKSSKISWKDYFFRVVPTAIATALDINLTNASLVFITISSETMCKSSAPVFLLLFAFAFKLEAPSLKLFGIISTISSGVLLTGLGSLHSVKSEEKQSELFGFVLVILASIMAGFRWTVTQAFLQKKEFGLNNPVIVMFYFAPIMTVITAILSLATEPWGKLARGPYFNTYHNAALSSILLLLGGFLAFFMVLAEYLLVLKTSAVTLTVAGVVKEMVTILVAVLFLGDQFTTSIGVGLGVIMIGVCWFNWFKYQKFKESKHTEDVFKREPIRYTPLNSVSNDDGEMPSF